MYAKNLSHILHQQLADFQPYDTTLKRFESLRSYGLLPRGRKNAYQRLTNEEIAKGILGYANIQPEYAGLSSLIFSDLRPVGGLRASFKNTRTLCEAVAILIANEDASNRIVNVTLSIARVAPDDEYHARLLFEKNGKRLVASYVSKTAISLLKEGAEKSYDIEWPPARSKQQLVLGREFFRRMRKDVALSRLLDKPFQTDWREYETEEELANFHRRLGAKHNSNFLNVGVDTLVTWPQEPTRIEFAGHHLVLFPKTKKYSHSISLDLTHERISSNDARTLLNRFLSLLSWCEDQHAILQDGWSGNPVPVPVPRRDLAFTTVDQWAFYRSIPECDELLRCLAYYREGLNAGEAKITSFEVLSFYKVLEIRYPTRGPIKRWISEVFEAACHSVNHHILRQFHLDRGETSIEEYVYKNCRVATAHAAEHFPSDADSSLEIRRLSVAAKVLRALARHFILNEFNISDSYFSDEP